MAIPVAYFIIAERQKASKTWSNSMDRRSNAVRKETDTNITNTMPYSLSLSQVKGMPGAQTLGLMPGQQTDSLDSRR